MEWEDLNIASKCFTNAIKSTCKSNSPISITISTQTEGRVSIKSLHDTYHDQNRSKDSPCKDFNDNRDFHGDPHRVGNRNSCRGSLGDYRDPVDNCRNQRTRKRVYYLL